MSPNHRRYSYHGRYLCRFSDTWRPKVGRSEAFSLKSYLTVSRPAPIRVVGARGGCPVGFSRCLSVRGREVR